MTRKKKTPEETVEATEDEKKIIEVIEKNDLLERLKEFDNKVLIERLQNLERKITVLHKEQIVMLAVLKEMHNNVINLNLVQEELINMLGLETVQESTSDLETTITKESEEKATAAVKAGKKWN